MKFKKQLIFLFVFLIGANLMAQHKNKGRLISKPNIVFILADDMGIGDVSGLNPQSKIETPNIDSLLESGMNFTDAHTSSAVCTPTRYGIITGRYSWRTQLKGKVLDGYSKSMINNETDTTPAMLGRNGYTTAMIGKWHLGWDWQIENEADFTRKEDNPYSFAKDISAAVQFDEPFSNGPFDKGFDYFYGINASLDFPPYTYLENNKVTVIPTETKAYQGRRNDFPGGKKKDFEGGQIMMRKGPKAVNFDANETLLTLTEHAVEYIDSYTKEAPFFLYIPLTSPHTPVLPREEFLSTSKAGIYGDFIQEMDWSVGQILKSLKDKGFDENTIVIFSADNGASKISFPMEFESKFEHKPSRELNGRKGSLLEGGHRVPFVVKWPNVVIPNSENNATICLNDLYATFADLAGDESIKNQGVDSFSILNLLKGASAYDRENTVYTDFSGRFAIRKGAYKLILNSSIKKRGLYNLKEDISETTNLYNLIEYKEIQEELLEEISSVITNGRSTKGEKLTNEGAKIWSQLYWLK